MVATPIMARQKQPSLTTRGISRRISGRSGSPRELYRPGVIAIGRIMATVIPGSVQSNRDRAELVALRRLGTVEDCAKVVEFLATDLSDYVTGAVIPIDGGLVRGLGHTVNGRTSSYK